MARWRFVWRQCYYCLPSYIIGVFVVSQYHLLTNTIYYITLILQTQWPWDVNFELIISAFEIRVMMMTVRIATIMVWWWNDDADDNDDLTVTFLRLMVISWRSTSNGLKETLSSFIYNQFTSFHALCCFLDLLPYFKVQLF